MQTRALTDTMKRITPQLLRLGLCACALALVPMRADARTHTVKRGDTLSEIASEYGVGTREIARRNGITVTSVLRIGQTLALPASALSPVDYVVRSGDTLGEIARTHGISVDALKRTNGIGDPRRLQIGQTLEVPRASETWSKQHSPHTGLWREMDATAVRRGRWRSVVIHHSASASGSAVGMDRYHRESRRMENGLAYHFVIGNGRGAKDGDITVGHRWTRQLNGGHLASETQNASSLGICLVGNFENSVPTRKQMEALRELVLYLMTRCELETQDVHTHRQINAKPTACPGKRFPERAFMRSLKRS